MTTTPTDADAGRVQGAASWCVRFRWLVLALFVLATLAVGWQARHFQIDASAETLLTEGNQLYLQSRVLQQRFPSSEFLLLAYAPHDEKPLTAAHLETLRQLTAEIEKLERVAAVRSVRNVPFLQQLRSVSQARGADLSALTVDGGGVSVEQLPALLKDHPIYENLLISSDQRVLALQVTFRGEPELQALERQITEIQAQQLDGPLSEAQRKQLEQFKQQREPIQRRLAELRHKELQQLRRIAAQHNENADIILGGAQVLGDELIRIVRSDLQIFGAAIALVIALLLLVLFRRLLWVAVTALCCVSSLLITLGLFAMLGFKATVISANFVALQLILTLAIVIHLIVQYRERAEQHSDWTQGQLVTATLRDKFGPCLYAGLTTSIGFASLLWADIAPVVAFGWMMIVAIGISLLVSLTLFPALLSLRSRETATHLPGHGLLDLLASIAIKGRALTVLAFVVGFAVALMGLPRLNVENSFINYFDEDTEVHQSLKFIDQHLGGTTPMEVVITEPSAAQDQDLVLRAQTVQRLQRLQHEFGELDGVGHQLSLVNFGKLALLVNDGKPLTEYELTALYRLVDEELSEELIGGFFSESHHQLRLNVRIQDATPDLKRSELLEQMRAALEPAQLDPEQVQFAGLFVLYEDLLSRLFDSQVRTLGLVFAALFIAFLLVFRSLGLALLAMVPNVVTSLAVLGLMGWLGIALDFMTITIAAVAMGIAVDDTIHYLHRYRQERAAAEVDQAIRNTHRSVGHALLYTTLIICVGFAMLGFSDFVPSVLFGLLTAAAIGLALITDLLLLPACLAFARRRSA